MLSVSSEEGECFHQLAYCTSMHKKSVQQLRQQSTRFGMDTRCYAFFFFFFGGGVTAACRNLAALNLR